MARVQKVGREIPVSASVERFEVVDAGSGHDVLSKGLDAVKARVSLVKTGQHVDYIIRVFFEGQSWTVTRRYNEFAALFDTLKNKLASVPAMPSKSMVRQFAPEYLEARKNGLSSFLREVCRRRDAVNCREVQDFLLLRNRVPSLAQPDASEPVQSAEVQEASFGLSHFEYDAVQGALLLGSRDFSWSSRVDTKITNIKMPWEKKAPNLPSSQMSLWQQSPAELKFHMKGMNRFTSLITCVLIANCRDKATCLAGLSDGTIGILPMKAEMGSGSSGQVLPLVRHTAGVEAMALDETEQHLFSASSDKAIIVFDLKRQMIQCEVSAPSPPTQMIHCQEQRRLFTAMRNGTVAVWDTSILPLQRIAIVPDGATQLGNPITTMDYDSSTGTLFTGSKDGIHLWAVKTSDMGGWGRKLGQITEMSSPPTALVWAASSREIIAGFGNGAVVVFDLDQGEPSYAIQAHSDGVTAAKWLDAPRRLLTASKDKTLKIWDFPSLQRAPLETTSWAPAVHQERSWQPPARPASSSFSGTGGDPLRSANSGFGGYGHTAASSPSGLAGGTYAAEAAPGSFTGGGYASPAPVSSSFSGMPAAQQPVAPNVVGRPKAAAAAAEDSEDDLAGWDS
ncbi:mhkB [Symbiodinium natans]|uniref:MhkB protein n=1 Tax=Symbiodinium natans TaxID=878477 RepID=A0A812PQU3_9DINO|nr:mhkB [Symbiodinium natans]